MIKARFIKEDANVLELRKGDKLDLGFYLAMMDSGALVVVGVHESKSKVTVTYRDGTAIDVGHDKVIPYIVAKLELSDWDGA